MATPAHRVFAQSAQSNAGFRVVLLGTGTPNPRPDLARRHRRIRIPHRLSGTFGRLSGDTRPSDNLVAHARGVDVIVHEVAASSSEGGNRVIATLHSTPEQAGEGFSKIGPKLAVYTHFSLFGTPEPTIDEIVARTRTTYKGPLEVGEDLMAITIGDSVTVQRLH